MRIIITSNKPVLTQMGRLAKDTITEVPHSLGQFLIDRGEAKAYETKAPAAAPVVVDEEEIQEPAEFPKKRGRKPKE